MTLLGILAVARPDCLAVAERLSPAAGGRAAAPSDRDDPGAPAPQGVIALPDAEFSPPAPFRGPLFATIEAFALAACAPSPSVVDQVSAMDARPLGVAVPAADGDARSTGEHGPAAAAGGESSGEGDRPVLGLVVPAHLLGAERGGRARPILVLDHVNLAVRGPLTGRWPAGRPRTFPSMRGIYQPAGFRPAADAAIYSRLVVAGVADAQRLSPFELEETRRAGLTAVSDRLVAPAVIAAYYGLAVAAVCVPQASPGPTMMSEG